MPGPEHAEAVAAAIARADMKPWELEATSNPPAPWPYNLISSHFHPFPPRNRGGSREPSALDRSQHTRARSPAAGDGLRPGLRRHMITLLAHVPSRRDPSSAAFSAPLAAPKRLRKADKSFSWGSSGMPWRSPRQSSRAICRRRTWGDVGCPTGWARRSRCPRRCKRSAASWDGSTERQIQIQPRA